MHYWQQGKYLNDRKYIVEELLGSGGYGVTYKVRNISSNQIFAIKTLNNKRQQQRSFKQLKERFINEIITLANCRHHNIVKVYSQFSENEYPCMVMEYIAGKDLAEWLETTGKFTESDAINIITRVGEALSYVHEQEFLHRDIKPANILLRQADLSPVLIDFGLAREYTAGSLKSMTNAKTECFAPIEQYQRNGNFGTWTDVYALAATLYVLLTTELPIPSTYRQYAPLIPPKQLNAQISERVNQAILKGMELEPENRPQSVQQWLELLQPVSLSSRQVELTTTAVSPLTTLQNVPALNIQSPEFKQIGAKINERLANLKLTNDNLNPYVRLRDLLNQKRWQEADRETIEIFLDLTRRKKYGSLRDRDLANIPELDLLKIDLLWLEASNNHFGFAIQRHIWQTKLGFKLTPEQLKNSENLRDFGRLLGWYEDGELLKNRDRYRFSLDAPQGHLPSLRFPCSEFPDMNWWQSWKRILSSFLIQTEKYS